MRHINFARGVQRGGKGGRKGEEKEREGVGEEKNG
jgi:hypothetical protein